MGVKEKDVCKVGMEDDVGGGEIVEGSEKAVDESWMNVRKDGTVYGFG